jgi:uncharacterized protein
LVALAAVVVLATPAGAHVTAQGEVPKGSFGTFAIQVPNENDTAATTDVEVTFPAEYPIANLRVEPVAGWQANVERSDDAVTSIRWTGGRIEPGQFQRFFVSGGPFPEDTDALTIPAVQTYDNGDVVRWIEETPEGGEEPEHPAPQLTLVDAPEEHGASTDTTGADDDTTAGDSGEEAAASGGDGAEDDDSNGLAIAALVVGIVALLVGGASLLRGRRPRTA